MDATCASLPPRQNPDPPNSGRETAPKSPGNSGETEQPAFKKDLTLMIELLGEKSIATLEIIRSLKLICGGLMACRSTGPRKFEVTMSHKRGKERLLEGFKINDTSVVARELNTDEMVVSFLNIPAYITDEEILEKLSGWGVSAISPIKRRMWPGTKIADGTRFLRVKFNDKIQSLPYSTRFNTVVGAEYFRVIHDRQIKVCRVCIQPGHILRDCPDFLCHKCGKQGHFARECTQGRNRCTTCNNMEAACICHASEEEGSERERMGEEEVLSAEEEDDMENEADDSESEDEEMAQAEKGDGETNVEAARPKDGELERRSGEGAVPEESQAAEGTDSMGGEQASGKSQESGVVAATGITKVRTLSRLSRRSASRVRDGSTQGTRSTPCVPETTSGRSAGEKDGSTSVIQTPDLTDSDTVFEKVMPKQGRKKKRTSSTE